VLDLSVSLAAAAVPFGLFFLIWLVSLPLRDASIADIGWGPALAGACIAAALAGHGGDRSTAIAILAGAWGLRLGLHIAVRNIGSGEDRRYVAMREKHGAGFARRSLWSVFGLQASVAWIVSLPAQSAAADGSPAGLGILGGAGIAIAVMGLVYEAVADQQLVNFSRDPANAGKVMNRGTWSWSRHPNYFGETVFWWATWLIALGTGSPWWTFVGPLTITYLLLKVSGVAMLEKTIGSRRQGYAEYVRSTSAFIPRPPRD
jgi:steroid 5-alpha reductase family enzyme